MPIYEYNCPECKKDFEKLTFGREKEEKLTCPYCQSPQVEKKFSVFGMKSGDKFNSSRGGNGCGTCNSKSPTACHNCG